MPFDGSGNFAALPAPVFPVVSGNTIDSSDFNDLITDMINNGLSKCITKDGQTVITAAIPFNGQNITGVAALTTSGNVTVGGNLAVTGTSAHTGNATFAGTVTITGTSAHTGNSTFAGTLGVTGAATLSSTLAVTGNTTVGGTLGVTGAVSLTAGLTVGTLAQALGGIIVNSSAGADSIYYARINSVDKGFFGAAGVAGNIIAGSTVGDLCIRGQTGNILISPDAGATNVLNVATAGITVAGRASVGDASFYLLLNGAVPSLIVDANDYMTYDRASNTYGWTIGSASKMTLTATGLGITGTIVASSSVTASGFDSTGGITMATSLFRGATQLLGAQGAAVADATDAASAITQLNALLARMRAHGLIAT